MTPIEIYFEQTPNPESLKLVTSQILLPNIIIDRRKGEDVSEFPMAESLFDKYDWISGVFVSNNFVTITKDTPNDWYEYMNEVREFIKMYISNGFDIVTKSYIDAQISEKLNQDDDSVEGRIKDLLEKYVKPAVEKDGGFIAFHSFENGLVKLKMQGSCSGCPSSQITLKSGIEGLLKRMVPEVMEVEAEAG
jgi:NFU1 iron-sulfur cluster scaffold homolog, mitochondrial